MTKSVISMQNDALKIAATGTGSGRRFQPAGKSQGISKRGSSRKDGSEKGRLVKS